VQRAGVRLAPDAKPATAAEGLIFNPWSNSIGADYFTAVGLPLLRGRAFTAAEVTQAGGPAVAIIDEVLAKKLWPEGDALGQRIQFPMLDNAPPENSADESGEIKRGESIEIVGIVPASGSARLTVPVRETGDRYQLTAVIGQAGGRLRVHRLMVDDRARLWLPVADLTGWPT